MFKNMKNYFFAALCLIGLNAFAQVEQEALYLDGGLSFNSNTTTLSMTNPIDSSTSEIKVSSTDFSFRVGGGYMVSDEFGVGLTLGLSNFSAPISMQAADTTIEMEASANVFSITPTARYFIELDRELYLSFQLGIGYGFGSSSTGEGDFAIKQSFGIFDASITPAITYFMSDNIAIDLRAGYIGYNATTTTVEMPGMDPMETTMGGFSFAADMSTVQLGILVMLNN
jgi:hypothetical protein